LPNVKNLGDVLYDGVIGGNHRHRDDHEKGCLEVVQFHLAESNRLSFAGVEILAMAAKPYRSLLSLMRV
jgi:hypothetical protein